MQKINQFTSLECAECRLQDRNAYLEARVQELESENRLLRRKVDFLSSHPTIALGMKGETLICELTGGEATAYAERFDVRIGRRITVEIKCSKLHSPAGKVKRWDWCKPLGSMDETKEYDFLVLIGDKDDRFPDQYPDDEPYVFFLLPMAAVPGLLNKGRTIGSIIDLSSRFATIRSAKSKELLRYLVTAEEIVRLAEKARIG